MAHDEAFTWDTPKPPQPARRTVAPRAADAAAAGRISLREAESRFGVRASTLRTWARKGVVDGIQGGARGDQWMVTPESVAHHLSRNKPSVSTTRSTNGRGGPAADGNAMLVPRDAWDKLLDQLGNLHEAGLQLAEARERAAKAETEASFLRERLAEMRSERDELKGVRTRPDRPRSSWWSRFRSRADGDR